MADPWAVASVEPTSGSADPWAVVKATPVAAKKPTRKANSGIGFIDRDVDRKMAEYEASNARMEAAKTAPRLGFVDSVKADFNEPRVNALAGIKEGWQELQSAPRGNLNPFSAESALAVKTRNQASDKIGQNVLGLITSPISGAMDVLTRPVARGAEMLGLGDEQTNRNSINMALSAAAPSRVPGASALVAGPKAPPKINALRPIVEQFDRAGINPSLAAVKGKGTATTANVVMENPIAGVASRARTQAQIGQAAKKADQIATGYGTARGPQIAGEGVQEGVQRFAADKKDPGSFTSKAGKIYDEAFADITAAEERSVAQAQDEFGRRKVLTLDDFENAKARDGLGFRNRTAQVSYDAEQAARDAAQADALRAGRTGVNKPAIPDPEPPPYIATPEPRPAPRIDPPTAVLKTPVTKGVLGSLNGRVNASKLSDVITDPRLRTIADALQTDGHNVRFADLRQLRTWVREAKSNPQLRQGIDQVGLTNLESALTQDIYANAEGLGGPGALSKLKRADQYYRAGSQRIETALQPFADARSGEGAYQRVIQAAGSTGSADAQKLVSLKRSLAPEEWGDVSSTLVKNLGKPAAGATGVVDGDAFSISNFVTNYNKLSPAGREVLFGSRGGGGAQATKLKAELDNLASVVDRLKAVEKGANASKSAVNAQGAATLGGGGAAIVGAMMGNPAALVGGASALGSMAGVGEVMTNPAFVRWLAGSAKAVTPAAKAASMARLQNLAATSPAIAEFARQIEAKPVTEAPVTTSEPR